MAKETLVERDGEAFVLYEDTVTDKPEWYKLWFPIGAQADRLRYSYGDDIFGKPVESSRDGLYRVVFPVTDRLPPRIEFRLENGGKTVPTYSERGPVPPPKVRKGTETRWSYGHWEKFSKREGWVPV